MHLKLHLILGLCVTTLLIDGQRTSRRGPGGRRSYPFRRSPGSHRHGPGIHHRRHVPYPSRYRPGSHGHYYPHRRGMYSQSPIQGSYRRTARTRYRPASAAPGETCRISSYDYYNRYPEDIVCQCCLSLNYGFCIYDYNCYGTSVWGRSRRGRSHNRSYRSRIGSRGQRFGRPPGPVSLADTVCALCRRLFFYNCYWRYCIIRETSMPEWPYRYTP